VKDPKKAFDYFQRAQESGNVNAMVEVGKCYKSGQGVKKSVQKAISLFQKAMEMGNANGTSALASCYFKGCGFVADRNKAVKLYQKAIETDKKCARAIRNLAACYLHGEGV